MCFSVDFSTGISLKAGLGAFFIRPETEKNIYIFSGRGAGMAGGHGCKTKGVARYTSFRLAPLARLKASSNIDELAFCFI